MKTTIRQAPVSCASLGILAALGISPAVCVAADSSTENVRTLEEIVVTAQKREQKLEDVPISISVLGGEQLDSSTFDGVTEALRAVPGVMTTATIQGGGTQLAIRGVSANNPVFSGPSPTAYYLDSVSLSLAKTAVVPDASLYDLQRVEVLRGPQGTLYGAGGMGGVVRVLTHDADLDDVAFKARTSVSSTQDSDTPSYRGDFAVNVPIIPGALAARATVSYQDVSGWIDRPIKEDANDAQILNARLKVRAEPTDRLSLGLTAWISRNDGNAAYSEDNRSISRFMEEPIRTDYDIYAATIDYDFASFSIRNTSSYIDYENDGITDTTPFLGAFYQQTFLGAEVFSNEINLYSTQEGAWRWTVGGIYRDSDDTTLTYVHGRVPPAVADFKLEQSRSSAIFGELTRLFLEGRLELTAGLRYFEDELTSSTTLAGEYEQETFDALTPRIILTAHPGERVTVYASYSEGFRSGYTQAAGSASTQFPAVDPDTLTNYEVGLKGIWLDGRLSFDVAAFYIDWQDTQQSLLVGSGPNNGPPFGPAGVNAESASGAGAEFSLTYQPISGLTLSAAYGWNDLTFDDDVSSGGVLLYPKGTRLNFSTETTASGSVDYEFPFGSSGFEGRLSASANYSSPLPIRRVSASQVFESTGDDLTFVRASVGVTFPGAQWMASLFVDNLTNEDGTFLENFLGVRDFDIYARPRTVGVQFEYRFGD